VNRSIKARHTKDTALNNYTFDELTESQHAAVIHKDGPMLVLAGPGSGKTRVITHRIAHLIHSGIEPRSILALTFTNKAAEEMRTRLHSMDIPRGTLICTFHSLCARLLREFAGRAGLSENFSIYDSSDQKAVVREALKANDLDPLTYPPARMLNRISRHKNSRVHAQTPEIKSLYDPLAVVFDQVYLSYQKILDNNAALDFDDLLLKFVLLLRNDSELRDMLSRRYQYVLVDEYQDTNASQYRISRELSHSHGNLFVTGDPDQSIYGWRGADISNILAFEKDFPNAGVVRLEENFRSTPQILQLADSLIQANSKRKHKRLIASKAEGKSPKLFEYHNEFDEARGVADRIKTLGLEHGLEYSQIAVFYRTNAMSRVLEEALRHQQIPYRIIKGLEFFNRKEIKDMLAYLRLLVNPSDRVALKRILNRPARGIGEMTIQRLFHHAEQKRQNIWSAIETSDQIPELNAGSRDRVKKFHALISDLQGAIRRPVAEIMKDVYERTSLKAALVAEKNLDAEENVEELINSAVQFDSENEDNDLAGYLRQVALVSDSDAYDSKAGAVSLMTLHAAKGLEFPAVNIIGIEDGLIPHTRSDGPDGIEEERRLLFVGITRAQNFLALSCAYSRTVHGSSKSSRPSSFLEGLNGLERDIVPRTEISYKPYKKYGQPSVRTPIPSGYRPQHIPFQSPPTPKPVSVEVGPFKVGVTVRHPSLGKGRIENVMPTGEDTRVLVQFDNGPRVTLMLKLARLEALS